MRKIPLILAGCFLFFIANAQTPIDIMETSVKVKALGGEYEVYCGFAEGDDIVFTVIETDGKEIKDIEVIEWPSNIKFSERKAARVENKRIHVNRTGIYKFRLHNSSIAGRFCKVKIQRIPASDATKNFNTTVYWKTIYDTSYYNVEEKYLEKSDTSAVPFFSQVIKIAAKNTTPTANKALFELNLPPNTKVWAAYIGVSDEGKEAYYDGREHFLKTISCNDTSFTGYSAMAALALDRGNYFPLPKSKERIWYSLIPDQKNAQLFQQDKPFTKLKEGFVAGGTFNTEKNHSDKMYIGLVNENSFDTEVMIKATAIVIVEKYQTRTVQKMKIDKRDEPYLKN